jgi:hypothetical protein
MLMKSRVDTKKLMPCYFGRAIRQIINWASATGKLYSNKRVLATKLKLEVVYRICHLNMITLLQKFTQLPSEGLALMIMMIQLTFGGAPCPSKWGSIVESIYNLANEILLRTEQLRIFGKM